MNRASSTEKKSGSRTIVIAGRKTRDMLSLSLLLKRFEYTVSSAHTAAEAIELISSVRPALVIADPALPGMSGTAHLHLLQQDKGTASPPVIFMIFPGDAAMERKCLDYGAAGCISKPVQAEELYQAVQAAIEPKPRTTIRIDTRLPVSVDNIPLEGSEGEGACAVDLSEHGMHVSMFKPYPRNKLLRVQISIKDRTISTEGSVLYSHASAAGSYRKPGMGLKFTTIALQDREFIRTFIRDEVMRDVTAALCRASSDAC
jgi:CheY-like chemotaxis protein